MQVRGTFAALYDNVDKTVYALLGKQLKELPPIWTDIYSRKPSSRKFERFQTVTPFGDVPEKPEGSVYAFDLIRPGYSKDVTPVEFGLGFEVTETAMEDDQFDVLQRQASWLAFSARVVQEKYAAIPFNLGFSTQLAPDGVALFSTAHVLAGGGTAKNRPSTDADLAYDSLNQAIVDVQTDTKLESGQLVAPVMNWILYVPPQLEMLADRLINSTLLPGVADNDVNPIKRRRTIRIVVNPYLTDNDAWFLVADAKETHGLVCVDRVGITAAPAMQDSRTGNRIYKVRFRQAWDAFLWQNIYGTAGA